MAGKCISIYKVTKISFTSFTMVLERQFLFGCNLLYFSRFRIQLGTNALLGLIGVQFKYTIDVTAFSMFRGIPLYHGVNPLIDQRTAKLESPDLIGTSMGES